MLILDSRPRGFGVTAFSEEDARRLLEDAGLLRYFGEAFEAKWAELESVDEIDKNHIAPNAGPMYFRGVWYPRMNVG